MFADGPCGTALGARLQVGKWNLNPPGGQPITLGYHLTFGASGFWLPNDPRGSWSNFVGSWELFRLGPAARVQTRTSLARQPHDRDARLDAKHALKLPAVKFAGVQ